MNEKYKKWMAEYLQTCAAENLKHWGDNDVPEFEQQFAKYFAERASSFEDATGKQFCWEGPLLDKTECQRQLESIGTPLSEIAKLEWPKGYMELVGIVETKLAMIQNRRTVRKKSKGKSVIMPLVSSLKRLWRHSRRLAQLWNCSFSHRRISRSCCRVWVLCGSRLHS